MYILKQTEVKV